jgi:phage baseplate assembly protein W
MFLQRKFAKPHDRDRSGDDLRGAPARRRLPDRVIEVVHNLDQLLATKRGIGHVLPDFGFSQSGHWSPEGLITHYSDELRENVARYEPRLTLLELDGEIGANGQPELLVEAAISGVPGTFRIVLDLVGSRVARVESM